MAVLQKVTFERAERNGRECWKLVREHETDGETFYCEDLLEVFAVIRAAYWPDGTQRKRGEVR